MLDLVILIILFFAIMLWILSYPGVTSAKKSLESFIDQTLKSNTEKDDFSKIEKTLNFVERKIEELSELGGIFEPAQHEEEDFYHRILPSRAISVEQIKSLLSIKHLQGHYGVNLLNSSDKPIPTISSDLLTLNDKHYADRVKKIQKKISSLNNDIKRSNKLKEAYALDQKTAIEEVTKLTLLKYALPKILQRNISIFYEVDSRIILIELEAPDLTSTSIVKLKKKRYGSEWVEISAREQSKLKQEILYSLCIRAAYLVAKSDINNNIDLIAINVKTKLV